MANEIAMKEVPLSKLFPHDTHAPAVQQDRLSVIAEALDQVLEGTRLDDEAARALAHVFPGASVFLLATTVSHGIPTIIARSHAGPFRHADHAQWAEMAAASSLLRRTGIHGVKHDEATILAAPVRRIKPGRIGAMVIIDDPNSDRCSSEDRAVLAILTSTLAPLWPHTDHGEEAIQPELFHAAMMNPHEPTPFDPHDREAVHMLRNQLSIIVGHAHMLQVLGRAASIELAAEAIQGAARQLERRYLQVERARLASRETGP